VTPTPADQRAVLDDLVRTLRVDLNLLRPALGDASRYGDPRTKRMLLNIVRRNLDIMIQRLEEHHVTGERQPCQTSSP
jgi:hypothetical protein